MNFDRVILFWTCSQEWRFNIDVYFFLCHARGTYSVDEFNDLFIQATLADGFSFCPNHSLQNLFTLLGAATWVYFRTFYICFNTFVCKWRYISIASLEPQCGFCYCLAFEKPSRVLWWVVLLFRLLLPHEHISTIVRAYVILESCFVLFVDYYNRCA